MRIPAPPNIPLPPTCLGTMVSSSPVPIPSSPSQPRPQAYREPFSVTTIVFWYPPETYTTLSPWKMAGAIAMGLRDPYPGTKGRWAMHSSPLKLSPHVDSIPSSSTAILCMEPLATITIFRLLKKFGCTRRKVSGLCGVHLSFFPQVHPRPDEVNTIILMLPQLAMTTLSPK